jgi:amino acid permease
MKVLIIHNASHYWLSFSYHDIEISSQKYFFCRLLASISVFVCTSVAALTWLCVYWETDDPAVTPTEVFDPSRPPLLNLLKAYGIISFQFDIHPMLLTIQVDMEDKNKIGHAVFSGLLVTCSLSIVTTILVYYTYEQSIASNVLESLPKSWTLYVIILLVTLQLCLSSAVGNSALFQHIEDVFNIPHSKDENRKNLRKIKFEEIENIKNFTRKLF